VSCTPAACHVPPRSGARAHLCKLRLRAVSASPRHPIALPQLETIRQSAGHGYAEAAAATSTVGSGAGAAPAARRPARDPRRRRGTETAARSAPLTPFRYLPLAPPSRKSLLGQICGLYGPICPLPPRPLSRPVPDLTTVPIVGIPPSGRLRPRGRGKPLPCLCAALWDRELSL